jgi:hypothetical protein
MEYTALICWDEWNTKYCYVGINIIEKLIYWDEWKRHYLRYAGMNVISNTDMLG